GTNTLRRARNAREFLDAARHALGRPVEIISGQEEARLIYLGIAHVNPLEGSKRLAVDIGGGSTEIIVGRGFDPLRSHSLDMGCVRASRKYFPDGVITRDAFRKAELAAALELRAVREAFRTLGWDAAIGSSGTINAVSELLRANGWDGPEMTLARMKKLRKAMITAGHVDRLELDGLKADRAAVLPGGLAILIAVFRSLSVDTMTPSSGALREGVLYDLVGRIERHDARDRAIRRLVEQYHVDLAQAGRVERTALGLLAQVEDAWRGSDGWEPQEGLARKLLTWGALLHEIGLTVSYSGYHKHGEYLVSHLDLPGFAADDQRVLATLVRGHRRKMSAAVFEPVPADRVLFTRRLVVLLRLAVLLNRSRLSGTVPVPDVRVEETGLSVKFPTGWLDEHPLTRADLESETDYLRGTGLELSVVDGSA
ncbi:MAG: exopolyphosphatase, partial [Gemmatimonadetes bacterium]|nr:exopolyphosphatase [Gemmatimonadota bacterium]